MRQYMGIIWSGSLCHFMLGAARHGRLPLVEYRILLQGSSHCHQTYRHVHPRRSIQLSTQLLSHCARTKHNSGRCEHEDEEPMICCSCCVTVDVHAKPGRSRGVPVRWRLRHGRQRRLSTVKERHRRERGPFMFVVAERPRTVNRGMTRGECMVGGCVTLRTGQRGKGFDRRECVARAMGAWRVAKDRSSGLERIPGSALRQRAFVSCASRGMRTQNVQT